MKLATTQPGQTQASFDHLVIGAETLAQGADYIQSLLGVKIPFGGVHEKMGTHNLLMRLSDKTFLEVIAINPEIAAPDRPRWFGLDDPHVRRSIKAQPALLTWVANTPSLHTAMSNTPFPFGTPMALSRGKLSWLFGLPADGQLLGSGLLPCLIEWQTKPHPAGLMQATGCRLQQLSLFHANPEWLRSILDSVGLADQVDIQALAANQSPYMEVKLQTPTGVATLRSILTG